MVDMDYPGRWLVNLSLALWALCAVLVVVWGLFALSVMNTSGVGSGFLLCSPGPGASSFGIPSSSWLPPGVTCTWDLASGETYVERPSTLRLLVVFLTVAGPIASLHLRGLLRAASDENKVAGPAS